MQSGKSTSAEESDAYLMSLVDKHLPVKRRHSDNGNDEDRDAYSEYVKNGGDCGETFHFQLAFLTFATEDSQEDSCLFVSEKYADLLKQEARISGAGVTRVGPTKTLKGDNVQASTPLARVDEPLVETSNPSDQVTEIIVTEVQEDLDEDCIIVGQSTKAAFTCASSDHLVNKGVFLHFWFFFANLT